MKSWTSAGTVDSGIGFFSSGVLLDSPALSSLPFSSSSSSPYVRSMESKRQFLAIQDPYQATCIFLRNEAQKRREDTTFKRVTFLWHHPDSLFPFDAGLCFKLLLEFSDRLSGAEWTLLRHEICRSIATYYIPFPVSVRSLPRDPSE